MAQTRIKTSHYQPHTNLLRGQIVYASRLLPKYQDTQFNWKDISIVIPAFNEAVTVGTVARLALSVGPAEVIVVDNNSSDQTTAVAKDAGAKVINCKTQGKAETIIAGVNATLPNTSIILFLDADLLGLQTDHLRALAIPFFTAKQPEDIMTLGTFDRGPNTNRWYWHSLPILTGQRALLKSQFNKIVTSQTLHGWEIEATLNAYFRDHKLPMMPMILDGLFHRPKDEKLTKPVLGQWERIKMLLIATGSYFKYPFRKLTRIFLPRR